LRGFPWQRKSSHPAIRVLTGPMAKIVIHFGNTASEGGSIVIREGFE